MTRVRRVRDLGELGLGIWRARVTDFRNMRKRRIERSGGRRLARSGVVEAAGILNKAVAI